MGLVVVAIVLGLIGAGLNLMYIGQIRHENERDLVSFYRVTRPLRAGDRLRVTKDVQEERAARQMLDGFTDWVRAEDLRVYEGQTLTRNVRVNEPLSVTMFSTDRSLLEHKIDEGMRACPLPLSSRNTTGLLHPGSRIDLYATFENEETETARSLLVLENAEVLAVGSDTDTSGEARRNATYGTITIQIDEREAGDLLTIVEHVGRDGFSALVRRSSEPADLIGLNPAVLELIGIER
jgi:Flp pilus assembly protein CpaB